MDLSSFKILKEDDSHYEIQHPNGKPFRVSKSGLKEKAHKIISNLKASGNNYDEGGAVVPDLLKPNSDYQGDGYTMTEADLAPPQIPLIPSDLGLMNPGTAQGRPINPEPAQIPINPSPEGAMAVSPAAPNAVMNSSDPALQQLGGKNLTIQGALENQKNAVEKEGQIAAAQGREEAKAIGEAQAKVDLMQTQQQINEKYKKEDDMFSQQLAAQKIDPDRLFKDSSLGSKLSAGIGLILGGVGSALAGQQNGALTMMQSKIDRDVEAQKNEQGKAKTLWDMNRQRLGNDLAADLATKNQLYMGLKYQLQKTAAQSGGQMAQQRALAAGSVIDQQIAVNRQNLAIMALPSNTEDTFAAKVKGFKMVNPAMAKDLEERYIPGVGLAKSKPTDKDRDTLTSANEIKKGLTELQALATKGTTIYGSEADAINKTKIAALQLQMKNAFQLGVLSQSDLDMLDKLTADPGAIRTNRSISQLEATKKAMDNITKGVENKLGVERFSKAQEQSSNKPDFKNMSKEQLKKYLGK